MLAIQETISDKITTVPRLFSEHSLQNENKHQITLKKQVGCFNHRVVTTVADKLKRQWL